MTNVSSLGLQILMTNSLQSEQTVLGTLTQQLASGKQHDNLTDYGSTDALNLLNFQNAITQRQSYIASMQAVQTRLGTYDTTMTDMESIASQASTLASQNQNFNPSTASQIQSQAKNFLLQVSDDLNQQVSGRYVYSGIRYSTQPVTADPTILNGAPQAIINDGTTLPDYDQEKISTGAPTDTNSYTADTVLIDSGFSVTYGISSNDPSFQKLINGLRYVNAAVTAGQGGNTATYQADMNQAATLLTSALSGIQALHTAVASNQNTLTQETTTQNTDITNLQNQLSNIQQVDLTKVGTEINLLQTQLQASYSATSSLEHLSLVKYL
jgi:flagellar hook-associated protein 3 FlgL